MVSSRATRGVEGNFCVKLRSRCWSGVEWSVDRVRLLLCVCVCACVLEATRGRKQKQR